MRMSGYHSNFLSALLVLACYQAPLLGSENRNSPLESSERAVNAVLDDFHKAASVADEERYFGALSESAVFLGTDASERWTKNEFREFVHPYFSRGQGWTYEPIERHVTLSDDGTVAWFDEHLENSSYGTCRGTGALQFVDGVWKIEQYNLMIPVPNELAKDLVARIRALPKAEAD